MVQELADSNQHVCANLDTFVAGHGLRRLSPAGQHSILEAAQTL